tara:strand:- start:1169 stop:1387 length:219 start_codon:yes stop_codon:yes gene_type:complete
MSDIPEFYDEYTLTRYTYKDHDRLSETTVTFRAEDLPEILEQFRYFLLGCSFTYVSQLKAATEEGNEIVSEE